VPVDRSFGLPRRFFFYPIDFLESPSERSARLRRFITIALLASPIRQ